jgi:hypothetical protein
MKALITACILLLFATPAAQAQGSQAGDDDSMAAVAPGQGWRIPITIGHFMVGSDLLFANANFQKGTDADYGIGIQPKLGVFILPGLALGLSMDIAARGNEAYTSLDYGISPFARVYFARGDISEKHRLWFFTEGDLGIAGTNTWYDANGMRVKATTNGFRAGLMPGLDYFINEHVALEAGLSYHFITGDPSAHQLYLGVGFQVFLGR